MRFASFVRDDVFSPALIAAALRTTREDLARTVGLGRDAVSRVDRIASPRTQTRLREMLEILNRVEPELGSLLAAYAWLRSEPLPGFAGMTAEELIRQGRAGEVRAWLDEVAAGGFA